MITVTQHDSRYLALRAEYRHKDTIKSLAPYPDVRWDGDSRCWLVDARMIDSVIHHLGAVLAPLPVDLVMTLPVMQPVKPTAKRNVRKPKPTERQVRKALEFGAVLHDLNPFTETSV